MPTRAELKENAKQILTGKWGKGALIVLCYVVASIVLSLLNVIPLIGPIAIFVVEVPMALGLMFSFVKLKRGENIGAFDFVKLGFQNFSRAWSLLGRILLKMLPPIIAMVVIMIVAMIGGVTAIFAGSNLLSSGSGKISGSANGRFNSNTFSGNYSFNYGDYSFSDISYTTNPYARSSSSYSNPYARSDEDYGIDLHVDTDIDAGSAIRGVGLAVGSIAIMGIVMIAMWAVSIWATCRGLLYALSYYIAYDNPEMTAKDVVQRSEDLMKGNRWKFFVLQLSFIGWAILASITFGIGYFWLIPYMMLTFICFYEALASKNNGNNGGNVNYNMNNSNNMNYANNNVNGMNNINQVNNQYNNMVPNMNQPQNNNIVTPDINQPQNINQAPEVTEYVPVNFEQNTNQFSQPAPVENVTPVQPVTPVEPTANQYNPVTPAEPTVNQYNPVTPVEPTVNQYNPVTPVEPTTNQYNPVTPVEPTANQYNPVTPAEPTTNQYDNTTPDANQFNPMNNDFNNPNNNNM